MTSDMALSLRVEVKVVVKPLRRSTVDHTVYLQTTPRLPLHRKRSPDGARATTDCGHRHLIATY